MCDPATKIYSLAFIDFQIEFILRQTAAVLTSKYAITMHPLALYTQCRSLQTERYSSRPDKQRKNSRTSRRTQLVTSELIAACSAHIYSIVWVWPEFVPHPEHGLRRQGSI